MDRAAKKSLCNNCSGDQDVATITATPTSGSGVATATDTTTVEMGQLRLEKTQCHDAACDGTCDAAYQLNQLSAKPGECIRYQIVGTNTGVSPVTEVVISDTTPQYTVYDDGSRNAAGATCNTGAVDAEVAVTTGTVTAPACNAAGQIITAGNPTLAPAATITLTFGVMVVQ